MEKIRLGKTELMVTRTAMGCLPIQRTDMEMAKRILRKAFDNGINFFDTAIRYTDSEEKLGAALGDVREQYILATKTPAKTKQDALADVHKTLERTRSTYVDLYQIHNYTGDIAALDDPNSAYAGLLEAKEQGLVRHIGITSHVPAVAKAAILSGKFETLQFPFNYLSGALEDELIALCKEHDMGFIAMKALSGGMVGSVPATFAYIRQYDNVVPIFGIQHEWELDEFLALDKNPPTVDEEMLALFEKDKKELGSEFCRACGYCMPCPVGINIPTSGRVHLLATRSPYQRFLTPEFMEQQMRVEQCLHCNQCASRCPYGLDTPTMLAHQHEKFMAWYEEHKHEAK